MLRLLLFFCTLACACVRRMLGFCGVCTYLKLVEEIKNLKSMKGGGAGGVGVVSMSHKSFFPMFFETDLSFLIVRISMEFLLLF